MSQLNLNKLFTKLENMLSFPKFNLFKTLYINFRCLPFSQAKKLPIFVYGPLKIYSLKGEIKITGTLKKGMIRIGAPFVTPGFSQLKNSLLLHGRLIFNGNFTLCNGSTLNIGPHAKIYCGNNIIIGNNANITSTRCIELGEGTRISTGAYIIDTNGHYILDTNTNEINSITQKISIGKYCWLGNNVSVSKGTQLSDYTIVANRSLLNRNYTKDVPVYSIIAGIPAKLIKTGFRRIYNYNQEKLLNDWFDKHGDDIPFPYDGKDMDSFCY